MLTGAGFWLFWKKVSIVYQSLKCYIKWSLSELNLENYIYQAFQRLAVKTLLNPYQGLKQNVIIYVQSNLQQSKPY
ncbi:MAG: hypothetical protein ACLGGO_04545 [Coleofasciculus sp.]